MLHAVYQTLYKAVLEKGKKTKDVNYKRETYAFDNL